MNLKTERLKYTQYLNDNNSDEEGNKKKLKESYSSFIIKMLENHNNNKYNKRNKRESYLGDFFKKTKKKKYLQTNYSQNIKNDYFPSYSKPLSKKNNSIKNIISYSLKINNVIKKRNNNSHSSNKKTPIHLNDFNIKNFKSSRINNYNSKNNNYKNKGKEENNKNKEKDKNYEKRKIKNVLNKLYGYDKKYKFSNNNILKNKNFIELDNYQNNILKISQRKLSRDNLIKLYTELQTIKTEANMIKPLPPINFPALVVHSFKEVDDKIRHRATLSYENKKLKDMDEYEKELYQIHKSNFFKRAKIVRNKRLYKIFEVLPEHIVDVVFKNKNKII